MSTFSVSISVLSQFFVAFYGFVLLVGIIGYWSTVWAVIVLVEHFVFRRNDWSRYNMNDWNQPGRLPWGVAAVLAFGSAFGIIIPSMSQVWYTGPIARAGTGDIGIIAGGGIAGLTLANMLERIGVDYLILEGCREMAPQVGASIGILPNGSRILDQIGLYDDIRKLIDAPLFELSLRCPKGALVTKYLGVGNQINRR